MTCPFKKSILKRSRLANSFDWPCQGLMMLHDIGVTCISVNQLINVLFTPIKKKTKKRIFMRAMLANSVIGFAKVQIYKA